MNHDFSPSLTDENVCVRCKRILRDHTKFAQCEACPTGKIGVCDVLRYANGREMLLCAKHMEEEEIAQAMQHQTPEKQEARLQEHRNNEKLLKAAKIDQSIELSIDIFNAETVALIELVKSIDSDESIVNKPYAKAQFTLERIKKFQSAIFAANETIIKAENAIRASQVYLNQIANTLREEERDIIRQHDISYPTKSSKPKSQPKPKATGAKKASTKVKIDMTEVNVWTEKFNKATGQSLPSNTIHMRMLAKNMTAEQAARTLAENMGHKIP